MAVTAYKFAGTALAVSGDWGYWQNPDYAKSEGFPAACYVSVGKTASSNLLRLTNFGFTSTDIPDGSTINGIEFIISRYSEQNKCYDKELYLYDDGRVGNNLSSAVVLPNTQTSRTYGGETDMCGTTLTQADIIASTFGVEWSVQSVSSSSADDTHVDYIKIRVYYTEGGGTTVKPHYYYLQQ